MDKIPSKSNRKKNCKLLYTKWRDFENELIGFVGNNTFIVEVGGMHYKYSKIERETYFFRQDRNITSLWRAKDSRTIC